MKPILLYENCSNTQCSVLYAANFQDIKHDHTDNKSLSGPDEFLLGALSRGTDDVISDCRTLWRA